jgi:hypothetical protein
MKVVREKTRASAVANIVHDGLIGYNRPFAGPARFQRLVLSAREGRRPEHLLLPGAGVLREARLPPLGRAEGHALDG